MQGDLKVYKWFKIEQKDKIREWYSSRHLFCHPTQNNNNTMPKKKTFLFGLAWSVCFTEDISHTREHLRNFFPFFFFLISPSFGVLLACLVCSQAMTPSIPVRNSIYIVRCGGGKKDILRKRKETQCYRISRRILNQKRILWANEKSNKKFLETKFFFWREDEGNRILAGMEKSRREGEAISNA